ncbi:MAG: SAM-dependent methyltransferase [Microthrixaceae bacterium]
MSAPVEEALAERIARSGSVRFDEFMDLALYGPGGFFRAGGGAGGRGGDFLTSPEVGPLFGAVVARYLDARWEDLGRPDPFVVVEAAAGRGALALAVLAAAPRCAPALRYLLVETSTELRERQAEHLALVHPFEVLGPTPDPEAEGGPVPAPDAGTGPLCCSLLELPAQPVVGVVLANELLDNVPMRLLEFGDGGWSEVRVTADGGRLRELLVPAAADVDRRARELVPAATTGARIPLQERAADWVGRALGVLERGTLVVIDYAVPDTAGLAGRPAGEWLRTYRGHQRGGGPLEAPGEQDLTVEVAVDQLPAPDSDRDQASWLRAAGIEELVEEGRRTWSASAGVGDLAALRARSRVAESEALCDPAGLGAFRVLEWSVG